MSSKPRIAARLFAIAVTVFMAVSVFAGTTTVQILIDKDNSASTGCVVFTAGGPFTGVDQIVTTTIDNVTRTVTGVTRQECIDPIGGVFGSPITIDITKWSVGDDPNHMFVETHVPWSALGFSEIHFNMHLGFDVSSGNISDLVLTGDNVTECVGGARGLKESDLARAYKSTVDPRLNYEQAMEIAMLIGGRLRTHD